MLTSLLSPPPVHNSSLLSVWWLPVWTPDVRTADRPTGRPVHQIGKKNGQCPRTYAARLQLHQETSNTSSIRPLSSSSSTQSCHRDRVWVPFRVRLTTRKSLFKVPSTNLTRNIKTSRYSKVLPLPVCQTEHYWDIETSQYNMRKHNFQK